ncbi:hypothetical protein ACWEKR_01685 [Nocardia sp. NPDC004573]
MADVPESSVVMAAPAGAQGARGRNGPTGYAAYTRAVRAEYRHVPDDVFRAGRAAVLRELAE